MTAKRVNPMRKSINTILGLLMITMTLSAHSQTHVTHEPFGKLADGTAVDLYTLKSPP